jgi:hypothetical protein
MSKAEILAQMGFGVLRQNNMKITFGQTDRRIRVESTEPSPWTETPGFVKVFVKILSYLLRTKSCPFPAVLTH